MQPLDPGAQHVPQELEPLAVHGLAFVKTLKTDRSKACMSVPTQVQLSKLMMEKAYYLHMRRLFPKMRLLFTDTDSVMVQIFELQDPLHAMAEANLNGAASSTWPASPRTPRGT